MTTPNQTSRNQNSTQGAVDRQAAKTVAERYAQTIKGRLSKKAINVTEARDGILDCFVASYHNGLAHGMKAVLDINAGPEDVSRVAAAIFRRRLKNHDVPFEAPTIGALAAVKEEADREFRFDELPAEFRAVHDQVCNLLLSKAEGQLTHEGNRSVLEASAPPEPVQATASGSVTGPASSGPVSFAGGVSGSLRRALEAYLRESADRAAVDSVPVMKSRLQRSLRLLDSIDEFELENN